MNERGSSLLQMLVAVVIIAMGLIAILQSDLLVKRTTFRNKQGETAMNILVQKMTRLSQSDFLKLAEYCRAKNILGRTRQNLMCLTDNRTIRQTASTQEFDRRFDLESPLDDAGLVATDPSKVTSCIEITGCLPKGGGHLLEFVVAQSYLVPAIGRTETRGRIFRRTRW